jgi:CDP-diacylglycerol--serine O-phosphatidyltransferase
MSSDAKKLAFFLPNTFTALNMACGFASMISAWGGQYQKACLLLLLGAIFDSVDGRIARMTGTQSQFGEQFDSLSDAISFGMAPSIIIYNRFFVDTGRFGLAISFIFLLCGAMRLARFNANIEKISSDYFQGLPIPGAAVALIGLVLFSLKYEVIVDYPYAVAVYVLFYSVLMISNIPFTSLKNTHWMKKHRKTSLVIFFMLIISVFAYETYILGLIILVYVVASIIYFLKNRKKIAEAFIWSEMEDE